MPRFTDFKISYTYCGQQCTLNIAAPEMHEADAWKYLADSLGLCYIDAQGYTMLCHAVRNMVEAHGVSDVQVQALAPHETPLPSGALVH
ncbi:hypothetical protein [Pseudomonas sp. Irchel 3E20]|uniref:hypothetical protein n=1 Tax=Pseudomonas sp. Irchel 3E20 TaxID=2008983 RepID=UPI000BA4DD6A|nr:hypothetical protein [Pseudomonas sp. Irchel 3E20]